MTTHETLRHRGDRPWRARLHKAAILIAAVAAAAVAVHWAFDRVLGRFAPDVGFQFVDAFATTLALALTVLALGMAWRIGAEPRT